MKAQKSVFGKVVQIDDLYLFEDSAGVKFNIPEFNEEGTNLYKRVKSACNNPASGVSKSESEVDFLMVRLFTTEFLLQPLNRNPNLLVTSTNLTVV